MAALVVRDGWLVGEPELESRGFLGPAEEQDIMEEAADYLADELRREAAKAKKRKYTFDGADAEDITRRSLKRFFGRNLRRKPIVVALAVELEGNR